jgi:L-ascorbate metabolism protein UlaG (beta-lactamase superfamily)
MTIQDLAQKIAWLGHDAFRIDASKTIYIDPYEIESGETADIILITHDHFDHCSPADAAKVQDQQTIIVTEKDSAQKLTGDVRVMKPGEKLAIDKVTIEATPAYNINKHFHPKEKGWLGFIIEIDGVRIYHAGDTDLIPEMKGVKVDIALLPVSGTYVMTSDEAVEAALDIGPALAIPMHYGAIVGDAKDADNFKEKLQGKVEVLVLEK